MKTHQEVKKRVDPENKLPVAQMDKVLNEKYNEAYPSLRSYRTGGYNNFGGHGVGRNIGKSITINPGVRGTRKSGPRLIA